jgi:hypothetical protein
MNIRQFLGGKVVARSNFKGLLRVFIPQDFCLVIENIHQMWKRVVDVQAGP